MEKIMQIIPLKNLSSSIVDLKDYVSDFEPNSHHCSLVIYKKSDKTSESITCSIHEMRSGLRTFKNCVENLNDGYKFDDNLAKAKIKALEKAIKHLSPHLETLENILLADRSN